MTERDFDVDKGFARLEEIVSLLEQGRISLSQSMALYEEGMALVQACAKELESLRNQVMVLRATPDGLAEEPLEDDEDDDLA